MESQFQKVTEIINELAASNPYITKEQVSKAKSMYNGDMRPIEDIRRELEAYSSQILEQGKKAEADRKRFAEKVDAAKQSVEHSPTNKPMVETPQQPEPMFNEEVENIQLQNMIDEAFSATSNQENKENKENSYTGPEQKETGKVYVKENQSAPAQGSSTSSESGYGNVNALLSLTIIFSLVTIIMAFFTIISR